MASQPSVLKNSLRILATVVIVAYPFFVYWGLHHMDVRWLALGLLLVCSLRWLWNRKKFGQILGPLALGSTVFLFAAAAISNDASLVKLYPSLVSVVFFMIFAASLRSGQTPVVEKIARWKDKNLSSRAVQYTRMVTKVWCFFFVINGSLCTFFALAASTEIWTLYCGFLSYILMGCLFGAEYLFRLRMQRLERMQ